MSNRRIFLGLLATAIAASCAVGWKSYSSTIAFHRDRVSHGSDIMASPFGQIEYGLVGSGRPILVVHGAGGGFDQGVTFATRLAAYGYQIIAPSRFGYLRSANPSDPSPENQADAFALMLDHLGLGKVDVIAVSAGAGSALQFAIRHPERCRSLIEVVPGVSISGESGMKLAPNMDATSQALIERMTQSDFLFWLGGILAHDRMIRSILATDPQLVAAASPAEREGVDKLMWEILPISERSKGLMNDARYPGTPRAFAFEQVRAPTLVISLDDDFYGTIEPARTIASKVKGARLITYPTGGHVMVGREDAAFAEMARFLASVPD